MVDGTVCLDLLDAGYDSVISVRAGLCDDAMAEVACNDDDNSVAVRGSRLTLDAIGGVEHFIYVDGFDGGRGRATLAVTDGPCDFRVSECLSDAECAEPGERCIDKVCVAAPNLGGCAAPVALAGYGTVQGNTRVNGRAIFGASCGNGARSNEVVYRFDAPESGPVCFNLDGTLFDSVLHVRGAQCLSGSNEIGCNDDEPDIAGALASAVTVETRAGESYHVFVDGYGFARGPFTLDVSPGPCRPPCAVDAECRLGQRCIAGGCAVACDDRDDCEAGERCVAGGCTPGGEAGSCAAPIELAEAVGSHRGTTVGGVDAFASVCSPDAEAAEVVFAFEVDEAGAFCVTTEETGFDTVLSIRTGDCAGSDELSCNDDAGNLLDRPWQSAVSLSARPGTTYYAVVEGVAGASGEVVLDIAPGKCRRPSFSGIRQNVPVAELEELGLERCFAGTFGGGEDIAGILQACSGDVLLIGCGPAGSPTLSLAAMGARQNVLTDVGQQNGGLHNHNGVDWYFNDSYSWGFVAEGTGVSRNSCDTRGDPGNAFRMCWHTGGGRMNGGYRCGDRFTSGNDYQRVIYHRSGGL